MTNGKKPSSGFTDNIDAEVGNVEQMSVDKSFHDIREIYSSESGHARVLFATRYGKRYALKCLKKDYLYTPIYRQVLTKEFEIGIQLDNPYICRTIGMEEVAGYGSTIIMEFIDGCTLRQLIDRGCLTRPLAWKIFRQLTDALSYMHSKGIYHRDLKPENIMITYGSNDVRLIDFSLSDSSSFSVLKSPAGTIGYVAPEQLQSDSSATTLADIYSLGKVLEDMAHATKDSRLMHIGKECAKDDPADRPSSIEKIKTIASSGHQSKSILALIIICLLLVVSIVVGLHNRATHTTKARSSYTTTVDSNDVITPNNTK